jgi:DNA primase
LPLISERTIVAVREATDIVSLISEYVRDLKIAGKNYKARCPFHREKTPSFIVSPERGTYRCFGCGEAGNVFSFLMKLENMSFPEAVSHLGKKAGIEVELSSSEGSGTSKLFQINLWAAKWFSGHLGKDSGIVARNYLHSRGLDENDLSAFQLGYAPDAWDALKEAGLSQGFSLEDMEMAGLLVKKNESHYYDRFRKRLIFPIFDLRSRVLGFGARVLEGDAVKYINSPESPIFKKSKSMYGIHQASDSLRKTRTAVLVEGYTDVLMSHQKGFKNVMATLGTAFTFEHARFLKRWVDTVILFFDGDEAGQQAAFRALPILYAADLEIKLVKIPKGKDPFDLLREGASVFLELLENAMDPIDFEFIRLNKSASPDEVNRTVNLLMRMVKDIPSAVRKELILKKIASRGGLRLETLKKDMSEKDMPVVSRAFQEDSLKPSREIEVSTVEKGLLTAVFLKPEKWISFLEDLNDVELSSPVVKEILAKVFLFLKEHSPADTTTLESLFHEETKMALISSCLQETVSDPERLWQDCLWKIREKRVQHYKELAREARASRNIPLYQEYERKRYELTRNLKNRNKHYQKKKA